MKKFNLNSSKWIHSPILIFLYLSFLIGCTPNQQDKDEVIVQEVTKTNNNMIYKFYKIRSSGSFSEAKMIEYINAFDKIYAENEISVVGTWYNVDDQSETYLITAFRDEQHYADFVEKMKTHDDYQRMSKEMEPDRLSIEAATLSSYVNN